MAQNVKVLMIVENLSVPADPRVWREACTLQQYGYSVSIICPRGTTRDAEEFACIDGINIYRYPLSSTTTRPCAHIKEYIVSLLSTFLLSLKVWGRHGFDVLHVANPPDIFFLLGLFYRLFGKKYIFDQHDLSPEIFRVKFAAKKNTKLLTRFGRKIAYRLLCFFERCSYRAADLVITTNISQRHIAITRGSCSLKKVHIVRNGPEKDCPFRFEPDPTLKKGGRYLLAYVGVMGGQDGVEYILHALYELVHRRKRRDLLVVLMGDGDRLPHLRALAHKLRLDDYLLFTGWLEKSELQRYLNSADLALSPDPSNELNDRSTMIKTMEYMAMGLPIVAFDLPETRYSAQEAALYAHANSVTDFTDKIEHLLADEKLRLRMGQAGRERIETTLCWEHVSEHLWQAYKTLFPSQTQSITDPSWTLPDPLLELLDEDEYRTEPLEVVSGD